MDGRTRRRTGLRDAVRGIGFVVLVSGLVLAAGWLISTILRLVLS